MVAAFQAGPALEALRFRAALALDRSHAVGERGPRTLHSRARVAAWLDGDRAAGRTLSADLKWLEDVAAEADV